MLTQAQKELRRSGVGGSDAAAIAGEHPYKGPLDVWLEKVHPDRVRDTAGMPARIGSFMEPLVRELYAERTGRTVREVPQTMRDAREPWIVGTVDGEVDDAGSTGILEIKRPTLWTAHKYTETDFPIQHFIQVQWYLRLRDRGWGDLAVLAGDTDLRIYRVQRDDAFIADLVEVCREWFARHITHGEQPEIEPGKTTRDVLQKLYERNRGTMLEAGPSAEEWAQKYFAARAAEKAAAEEKEEAGNALCTLIGDADGIESATWKATWKWREPTVVQAYERAGYRAFDLRELSAKAIAKKQAAKAA